MVKPMEMDADKTAINQSDNASEEISEYVG